MNNRKLSALIILTLSLTAGAKTLTPDQALSRVLGDASPLSVTAAQPRLVHTTVTEVGEPAVYVFDRGTDNGYMILSADDIAYPVLAYSESGALGSVADMPAQMQWWLEEYGRQIAWAKANPQARVNTTRRTASLGAAIAPQIKTSWDQGAPYNNRCPLISGVRTYTGCVATAMAQVMNYWEYPAVGKGSINYSDDDGCGKRLSFNFANHRFDWANMADSYTGAYTDDQAAAVALLMQAAGYSVKMSYGTDSSGALAMNVGNAFVKYFGYDGNIHYTLRAYYSGSQWERMVYENLRDVGPIMYGGSSMIGGGHSFIVDGYDGNGFFHFNWGWSEMSDGYYSLDALNPSALGAGGGSGGGYNFTQDAVFGIQPPTGKPVVERPLTLTQMGTLTGVVDADNMLNLDLDGQSGAMWVNYQASTLRMEFGVMVEPAAAASADGDKQYASVSDKRFEIQPGYGVAPTGLQPQVDLPALGLADGKYRLTLVNRRADVADSQWTPLLVTYGDYNYVLVDKAGDTYTIDELPVNDLQVVTGTIDNNLYVGTLTNVSVTVTNPTEYELSRGFAPMLFDAEGQPAFLGESVFLTVAPGETVTKSWQTTLMAMTQSAAYMDSETAMGFTFFDESTYGVRVNDFYTTVSIRPEPALPSITLTKDIAITGATAAGTTEIGGAVYPLYEVESASDMEVTATLRVRTGTMAYNTYAVIVDQPDEDGRTAILAYNGMPMTIKPLRSADFKTTVSYKQAIAGRPYLLTLAIERSDGMNPIGNRFIAFKARTGVGAVDDIAADGSALSYANGVISAAGQTIRLYNMQGVLVATGNGTLSTDGLPAALYIARTAASALKLRVH